VRACCFRFLCSTNAATATMAAMQTSETTTAMITVEFGEYVLLADAGLIAGKQPPCHPQGVPSRPREYPEYSGVPLPYYANGSEQTHAFSAWKEYTRYPLWTHLLVQPHTPVAKSIRRRRRDLC
jgi:hypothetical protein